MVDEESGLLSAQPVDVEFESVLHGDVFFRVSVYEPVFLSQFGFVRQGRLALVVDVLYAVLHDVDECPGDGFACFVHSYAMCLHDGCGAVTVDDESWEVVSLSVYETVGVVCGIVGNSYAYAHGEGLGEAVLPGSCRRRVRPGR